MAKIRGSDVLIVLRGLNAVSKAAINITEAQLKEAWTSSSFRPIINNVIDSNNRHEIQKQFQEVTGRTYAVVQGLKEFSSIVSQKVGRIEHDTVQKSTDFESLHNLNNTQGRNAVGSNDLLNVDPSIIEAPSTIVVKQTESGNAIDIEAPKIAKILSENFSEISKVSAKDVHVPLKENVVEHAVQPPTCEDFVNKPEKEMKPLLVNESISSNESTLSHSSKNSVDITAESLSNNFAIQPVSSSNSTDSLEHTTGVIDTEVAAKETVSEQKEHSFDNNITASASQANKDVLVDPFETTSGIAQCAQNEPQVSSEKMLKSEEQKDHSFDNSSATASQANKDVLVDAFDTTSENAQCAQKVLKSEEAPSTEETNNGTCPKTGAATPSLQLDEASDMKKESEAVKQELPEAHSQPPIVVRKKLPKLSESAKENTVPSSRIGRLASYGSLAAGLGFGALAEVTRRSLGLAGKKPDPLQAALDTTNPFLTEANVERIVNTLCKVRGAALKLGQMLSIQDSSLIHPQLLKIFERVRQSADFMPVRQMEKVLVDELGAEWRDKLKQFDEKPFAAASVGQVHYGVLHDGREVAMKIQYPGVAKGIESDINNLVAIMKVWNILPEGLFVNEFIEVAKRELSWEVDYVREAEATRRFKSLLKDNPDYKVPAVIDGLCSKQVFTTEFVEGISMEKCMELDQDTRNDVAGKILRLCLTELFEFQFMQTDPNWANFQYNTDNRQLVLLDFGASREYGKKFVDSYIRILEGAAEGNRQKVLEYSQALGFLTGYESKSMEDAHIEAVMILGEAFRSSGPFDFGQQDTTRRIQKLVPVMLNQRLKAPPEETYSLHRKMSGAFLLSAKLGAKIDCKSFFDDVIARYHARQNTGSEDRPIC